MRQTYWDGYIYIYYINIITQPSQCYLDMSENGGHPNLPVVLRGNMMIKHESGLGVTHYWRNQSICRFSKFIQHTHRDNAQQLSLGFHFLQVGFHLKKHVVEIPFPLMTSWKSQCPESEVTVVEIQFLSSRIFGNKYIGPGYESDSLWVCGCWTGLDLGTHQFSGAQLGFFDVTDFRTVLACSSWFQHDTRGHWQVQRSKQQGTLGNNISESNFYICREFRPTRSEIIIHNLPGFVQKGVYRTP